MTYLSEVFGKPVVGLDGMVMGKLVECWMLADPNLPQARIRAWVIEHEKHRVVIPLDAVVSIDRQAIQIGRPIREISDPGGPENGLSAARDLLDHQVMDLTNMRLARINDIELARSDQGWMIEKLDVGMCGLLRQLGWRSVPWVVPGHTKVPIPDTTLRWENALLIDKAILSRSKQRISALPAIDLARLLCALDPGSRDAVSRGLDHRQLAKALSKMDPDAQRTIFLELPDCIARAVIGRMSAIRAADMLANLPSDARDEFLHDLRGKFAAEVISRLRYPKNTAGAVMSTRITTFRPNLLVRQAVEMIQFAGDRRKLAGIYVTDPSQHLLGTLSLQDLLLADPDAELSAIMQKRVWVTRSNSRLAKVIRSMARYHLLTIPVVDDRYQLIGSIDLRDALDCRRSPRWKAHLRHPVLPFQRWLWSRR